MRIFEAGSFGYDLSYEAQKRYADTDARAIFFALRALPNVAAITIFSDTTFKYNLSPKTTEKLLALFFCFRI